MLFVPQAIPDVVLVVAERLGDHRGDFAELYRRSVFAAAGIGPDFVQENRSCTIARGTIRGLHLQIPPAAQGKLVRVVRGAVFDVAVDVRRGSPTYGRWVALELSAENDRALWIPRGFLHGFCTLAPHSEVRYLVTAEYDPKLERGVVWDDPDLALPWPISPAAAVLSEKDRAHPRLNECRNLAAYRP